MILNVGCGAGTFGDVRTDLGPEMSNCAPPLLPTTANIYCDAEHLPFRPKAFDMVYSSHVIEHLDHPALHLREMERVGRYVSIRCPHWAARKAHNVGHKWAMHVSFFKTYGYNCAIVYSKIMGFPVGLAWVNEIVAEKACP